MTPEANAQLLTDPLDQIPVDDNGQPDRDHTGYYEQPKSLFPSAGDLVQVSFFDGVHQIRNAFGHVLSVSPAADNEYPFITVVYPNQPVVDTRNLSGPDWFKAFVRRAGVPHITHESIEKRTSSIAYQVIGGTLDLENLFEAPAGNPATLQADGQKRQLNPAALKVSPQLAYAVQSGSVPSPTVNSPLVNEQLAYETKQYADGSSATGVAPLPDVSPEGSPVVLAEKAILPTEANVPK
jgi:hypothetical protein